MWSVTSPRPASASAGAASSSSSSSLLTSLPRSGTFSESPTVVPSRGQGGQAVSSFLALFEVQRRGGAGAGAAGGCGKCGRGNSVFSFELASSPSAIGARYLNACSLKGCHHSSRIKSRQCPDNGWRSKATRCRASFPATVCFYEGMSLSAAARQQKLDLGGLCGWRSLEVGSSRIGTNNETLRIIKVDVRPGRWLRRLGHQRRTGNGRGHGNRAKVIVPRAILQWNRRPVYAGEPPRVVVITSGKGGVGKTTTTANLGMCLARLNFRVVAIDADVGLRNLDLLLGLENRVNYTAMEVLNGECRLDQALIRDKRWTNFELLCINKPRYKMPLSFGGKALTWLVDALKKRPEGSPDFILIDCPAGIDAGFITAITPANEAVIVTTPDITSLRDADRVTGLLECDGIKDIKMVVNRVRSDMIKGEDMMSVLDVQEMLGLPLLGVIPEDSEVIKSTNRGYPLVLKKPPTLAGLALEQAAWRLVEQDSMKAVLIEEKPQKRSFLPFLGG